MAEAVAQAERERELTKQALAGTIDRLEARVRAELDWKARLRRDGVRYAIVGGAVLTVAVALVVLRSRLKGADSGSSKDVRAPSSLDEIAAELTEIRKRLEAAKVEPDSGPLWQKIALRAVSAGAAAGGTFAARRFMARATEPAVEPPRTV